MRYILLLMILLTLISCGGNSENKSQTDDISSTDKTSENSLLKPGEEKHLANIRQLTFGGENAEAYFSADGKMLSFQSTRDGFQCDQIYTMKIDGSDVKLVSTGKGRTTCAFISPDSKRLIYASTHLAGPECPPPPDMSQGYVWSLYPEYDIFECDIDGSNLERLTDNPYYDAEGVYSPDGKKIVFTSLRNGDLDIYTMDPDGGNVTRVTSELGYDGGAFFSPDSKWLCYRADHPKDSADRQSYLDLLAQNKIRPGKLEVYIIRPDGSERHQVTNLGGASFCPYFHPDGKRIIFASNYATGSMDFNLYMINTDGTGLEQITFDQDFDGFPMFSPDGKKLVFASNRNQSKPGETNIFIADWIE